MKDREKRMEKPSERKKGESSWQMISEASWQGGLPNRNTGGKADEKHEHPGYD